MDGFIKQSTAHTFQIGPFLDSTDGVTAEASLTIAASAIMLSKHGAALAAKNDATALTGTGDSHGYYDCVLNATDTGTLGTLKVEAQIAGACPVWHTFQVLSAQAFEALCGTGNFSSDAKAINGVATTSVTTISSHIGTTGASTAQTADHAAAIADIPTVSEFNARTTADPATATNQSTIIGYLDTEIAAILEDTGTTLNNHLLDIKGTGFVKDTHSLPQCLTATAVTVSDKTGFSLAADQSAVTIGTVTTNTDMRGTDNAALDSVCTETRLAELDAANLPTDVAAVKTDTGNIATRITSTLFAGITSLAEWLGLIAGKQVGDATARTELRATGAGAGTFDETTDSVEALRNRGDAAWVTGAGGLDAAGVRAAVGLAAANLDTQLGDIPTVAEFEARTTADPATATAVAAIPIGLRRGVALDNFEFLMVLASDGKTPGPGLTVSATISKNGEVPAATSNAVVEVGLGWYKISLTAAEMTADNVRLVFTATTADQRNIVLRTSK